MHTWDDAASLWLVEKAHKATIAEDAAKLRWFSARYAGLALDTLDRETVMHAIRDKALATSAATANRYLALIRALLRRAVHVWEWLPKAPHLEALPEPLHRVRWLTPVEVRRLLDELPLHQCLMVRFALATGLRQANVVGLTWSQVDLHRSLAWIHADQAKARHAFAVPLNESALAVLGKCRGRHAERVFTFRGRPIANANTAAWRKALKRAGISDFRWHDLRHTWASWHVQSGTPLHVLQDLGAWRTESMVKRYAHLSIPHYAAHAAVIDNFFAK